MIREMSQKEVLETVIGMTRKLMESTRNPEVQAALENALMYIGQVRGHIVLDGIPEYDSVMLMKIGGRRLKVEL
jgi:hypothetical protein